MESICSLQIRILCYFFFFFNEYIDELFVNYLSDNNFKRHAFLNFITLDKNHACLYRYRLPPINIAVESVDEISGVLRG